MEQKHFVEKLLYLLPYWNNLIIRPFKKSLKDSMSLQMYYGLQLLQHHGVISMSELGRLLGTPKQHTTKIVQKLVQYGFVERISDETDRRVIKIQITPKALDYIEYCKQGETFTQWLEHTLGVEEMDKLETAIETILNLLIKIEKNLN
ncbi:MarR family winged helix-turn-helix transcriptional regulator [Marasmitruncus massiliensis]|uniref:MarR family winged helix-turn-helix transcriptional regulator n=1 Tax=Marasmitruncus massiliensis TaxID=1944642 RepID=UPI0015E06775|nr:MarR family transcriptional regulator [Marasmitruncus massiliensis]